MTDKERLLALEAQYRDHIIALNQNSMTDIPFDLFRIYPETADIKELTEQVDDLKRCLDSLRPISQAQLKNLQEALDVEYTYESNRIEGNTLTLRETFLVVDKGMTIGGKSLTEHLEAINHRDALQYVRDIATKEVPITERVLLDIHSLILSGIDRANAGKYRNVDVAISGARHRPPSPFRVAELMKEMFAYYEAEAGKEHPVFLAANMHERLVTIHPFVDGNGRTARLLMNLILLRNDYLIANISGEKDERYAYYDALEAKQVGGDEVPFHRFILSSEKKALIGYIGMLSPDIEEGRGGYYLERIAPFLNS